MKIAKLKRAEGERQRGRDGWNQPWREKDIDQMIYQGISKESCTYVSPSSWGYIQGGSLKWFIKRGHLIIFVEIFFLSSQFAEIFRYPYLNGPPCIIQKVSFCIIT